MGMGIGEDFKKVVLEDDLQETKKVVRMDINFHS